MGPLKARELVDILEHVYRVERDPRTWLREVTKRIAPYIDAGLGVASYFVDMSDPDAFLASSYGGVGMLGSAEGKKRFARWERQVPVAIKRHIHSFGACGTGASIPPRPDLIAMTAEAHQLPDMLGINAIDASGHGCAIAAALPRRQKPLAERKRVRFERVAAHLAAALRICRKLDAGRSDGEAIIEPSGKVQHAEGAAKKSSARDALRRAALDVDRARTSKRRLAPEEVTDLWRAIVAERWSIVDRFERDGRRYFVAHANAPIVRDQPLLSEREARVTGAVALGHTNAMIAYELGISMSSVATHLKRAARKLGTTSRVELVNAYLELLRTT